MSKPATEGDQAATIARLTAALKFYADPKNWDRELQCVRRWVKDDVGQDFPVDLDTGQVAREALGGTPKASKVEERTGSRVEWHGDKQNGIEFRYVKGLGTEYLDEVVAYADGKVVSHLECLAPVCYHLALYTPHHTAHVWIQPENNRSHIDARAEAWKEQPAPAVDVFDTVATNVSAAGRQRDE